MTITICRMELILSLLAMVWAVILADPIQDNNRLRCPTLKSCQCDSRPSYLEIACREVGSSTQITVHVKLRRIRSVNFECNGLHESIYKILPDWNIGEANQVNFRNCPMSTTVSIMTIFDRLGIQNVRTIDFSSISEVSISRRMFTGLGSLKNVRLNRLKLLNLSGDVFDDVRNITSLEVRSNNVYLSTNIFQYLYELEFLELEINSMRELGTGLFRNLSKLKSLNLWGKNLQNITKDAFIGVSAITALDLGQTNMPNLPSDIFQHLTKMTVIKLGYNRLWSLPEGLFRYNSKLSKFRMTDNARIMQTLPRQLLANLPTLSEVLIIRCNLRSMPEDLFADSPNIENITISSNELTTLPHQLFKIQKNLIKLDLSYNLLTEITDGTFDTTPKLVVLNLSHNRLHNISEEFLRGLCSLRELYLNDNDLYSIHMYAMFDLNNLEILYLHNNYLDFVHFDTNQTSGVSPFHDLEKLKVLNLSNNSISYFVNDWDNLKLLEKLDLRHNKITAVNCTNTFEAWTHVTIDLSYNEISTIGYNLTVDLKIDTNWILNNNPLNCDCMIMKFVQYLRRNENSDEDMRVKFNIDKLSCALPQRLAGRSLRKIVPEELLCPMDATNTTTYCPLKCECWIRPYDQTGIVNCSNAELMKVPQLPDPRNLSISFFELDIQNNAISSLPSVTTVDFKNVTKIFARNNSIRALRLDNLPDNLEVLDLTQNKLQSLSSSVLTALNQSRTLQRIFLARNPWICDCGANELLQFLHAHIEKVMDYGMISCSTGERLIDRSDLCPVNHIIFLVTSALALLGCLIGLVVALFYKYEQEVKVWMYAHNLCLWWVTEEDLDKDRQYDAFISYSHKDTNFVEEQLVPELENGLNPFKLCLHERDFIPGELITDQISKAVKESRRTVIVLSENFKKSTYGKMEFELAHQNALLEKRARVIIIIYGDIGNIEDLDPQLQAYLKTNTYIKWGDPWFFRKLRYALPHRTNY